MTASSPPQSATWPGTSGTGSGTKAIGEAPKVKGKREANPALKSLLEALANAGLIKDETEA